MGKQRRGHRYIAHEDLIPTNRVKDAINLIKERNHLTSNRQVANLLGHGVRVLYRLQQHKVLPLDLGYLHLWAELSGRGVGHLTGEWDKPN